MNKVKVTEKFNTEGNFTIIINNDDKKISSKNVSIEMRREIELYYKKIRLVESLNDEIDIFKENILIPFLKKHDKNAIEHRDITLTKVDETVTKRFDTKKFREVNETLYEEYLVDSIRKEYIVKKENPPKTENKQ